MEDVIVIAEIRIRITIAKVAFFKMENILTKKNLSLAARKKELKCYEEPILLYVKYKQIEKHPIAA